MTSQDIAGLQDRIRAAIQRHWKAVLIEGILFVVLGLAAILVPAFASLAITIFLGWLFLVSGAFGLAMTFWERHLPGFLVVVALRRAGARRRPRALGAPGAGHADAHPDRRRLFPGRGHFHHHVRAGASPRSVGALGLAAGLRRGRPDSAGLIIAGLPGSAVWAIGLLVGIDMVFGGASLISMALAARDADRLRTHCGWGQTPGAT